MTKEWSEELKIASAGKSKYEDDRLYEASERLDIIIHWSVYSMRGNCLLKILNTMWNEIIRNCICLGFMLPFVLLIQYVSLAIYKRLFGVLYRYVSQEWAEPISFYVALSPALSVWGWIVYFYIKFGIT